MARERVDFKSISVGDGFLIREHGIVYLKTGLSSDIQITGPNPGRDGDCLPEQRVIWLGKVVDVVVEL